MHPLPWARTRRHGIPETVAIALNTLEYARRLREAGFTEQQAEGQAQALAAAMTDTLATKGDLTDLDVRTNARFDTKFEARFDSLSMQLVEVERRTELRLGERFADLERRMTVLLLAGVAAVSALVRLQ